MLDGPPVDDAPAVGAWPETTLVGANLTKANLRYANLSAANLSGANLTGARLFMADISNVVWAGATCPSGSKATSAGC
ncbi:MAG: pentapeptide repeat-containing protein [Miltoncostaeaceae bacterium]